MPLDRPAATPLPDAPRPGWSSWRRWSLGPTMWVFMGAMLLLPAVVVHTLQVHAREEALENARSISTVVTAMRSYYTQQIVRPLLAPGSGVKITERYHDIPGAIPIPATLSIELGDAIRRESRDPGFDYQFTSDHPFANRVRRPLDAFEIEALRVFRQGRAETDSRGQTEFWRLDTGSDGKDVVRLARPVRMEAGCVNCHNSHPDSPVRNWMVGDVRGIQEVSVMVRSDQQVSNSTLLAAYLGGFALLGLLVLKEHTTRSGRLRSLNSETIAARRAVEAQRQALQDSVRELSTKTTVLDRAPFSILVLDPSRPDNPLSYVNEAFCRITGFEAPEVLGRHPRFLFGPATDDTARQAVERAVLERRSMEIELVCYRRAGTPLVLRWLVFPSFDDAHELLNIVVCLNDVTAFRQSESERVRLAGELQESTKLEFLGLTIAGMAHDLNTPIGVAVTASSLVQRHVEQLDKTLATEPVDAQRVQLLGERIRSSSDMVAKNLAKAAQLVHGFKQTSAEVTRAEWRPVNLHPLLDSLLVTLSPLVRRAGCEVQLHCPARMSLHTDPGALSQALTNLIVNATVHAFDGPENRRITVSVTDGPQQVAIEVRDNGRGMSEEALANAFRPFFTTRRAAGGSGLGLFSSRRAVEQNLGGTISVASQAGQGTVFTITLPRREEAPARPVEGVTTNGA